MKITMRMNCLSLGRRSNHCTIVVRVQMQQMNESYHDYEMFVMFTVEAATIDWLVKVPKIEI